MPIYEYSNIIHNYNVIIRNRNLNLNIANLLTSLIEIRTKKPIERESILNNTLPMLPYTNANLYYIRYNTIHVLMTSLHGF